MRLTSDMIVTGLQVSLPVVGALLLTDLTLGLLARVAPQIQVFFLGMPLKIGIGLGALALSLGTVMPVLARLFHNIGPRMLFLLGY
jgi:flagellar biosynthetic protein FliR